MAYTKFGEFVRILRIKNHEVMGTMAERLGVKTSFLSAVENGKRNVPNDWIDKIACMYNLTNDEVKELGEAIEASKVQYKIVMGDAGNTKRQAALKFARSFEDMDDETAMKILKLLTEEEDSNN